MTPSKPPIDERLRTIRRRVAAGVLAAFVAAWVAVAALGKGGASSSTASAAPTAPQGDGSPTLRDDGSDYGYDDGSGSGYDDGSDGGQPSQQSQPQQSQPQQQSPGPVITGQS
jgi:hypothetical protein